MPNKESAKKALRQAKKRAVLNLAYKTKFREAIKKTVKSDTKRAKFDYSTISRSIQI